MNYVLEKQNLYSAIAVGPDAVIKFYDTLLRTETSKENLVEFAFQVLETSTETTQYTAIYRAGFIIEDWGTAASLERLLNVRKTLPVLAGLRDYRVDFDLYIALLKNLKLGTCKCNVYSAYNTPSMHKLFVTESSSEKQEPYSTETIVHCTLCNTKYKVETDFSYHYPIARWQKTIANYDR